MKKYRQSSNNVEFENRKLMSNIQGKIPQEKLEAGSIFNKHAVVMDGGKTIIFITDKKREKEIRCRYGNEKSRRSFSSFYRPF